MKEQTNTRAAGRDRGWKKHLDDLQWYRMFEDLCHLKSEKEKKLYKITHIQLGITSTSRSTKPIMSHCYNAMPQLETGISKILFSFLVLPLSCIQADSRIWREFSHAETLDAP